nr:hypothetical protein Iba_chr06aCG16730 [Ipomoea batatas]
MADNDVLNDKLSATEEGAHQSKMADYVIIEDYVKKLLAIHSDSCEDHQDQKKVGSNDVLNGELPATEEGAHQSKMADYVIIEDYVKKLLAIDSGSCEDKDQKKVGSNREKMIIEGDSGDESDDEFSLQMVERVGNKESITAQKVKADEGEGSARS